MSLTSQAEPGARRLPLEATGFVGRQAELSTLGTLLSRSRLVTVTGPGGIGKTRLALRYAAREGKRYSGGVVLAELSGLRDPDLLALTVASAAGLAQMDGRGPLEALTDFLRPREMLLILDTCEHLIDACAFLAEELLREAPRVTILATSRQTLDTPGESICPLGPLRVPGQGSAPGTGDAVELFAQRADAAVAGFRVTEQNRDQVIRLCQQLDGIPLALELAAVRLRAFALPELTERLGQRLSLLQGARHGIDPRHHALRDAIGWSYDLCTAPEQTLWCRLSAFAGPFTVQAAEEVCAGSGLPRDCVLETLINLVDKSVLSRSDGPVPRYRMLDTIREYGAERLDQTGTADEVRARLVAYYRRLLEEFDRDPVTGQLERYRTLRAQHENIRAAVEHGFARPGQDSEGIRLVTSLYWYVLISGEFNQARYWIARLLERTGDPSPEHAHGLLLDGLLRTAQGAPEGLAHCEKGLAMAESLGARRVRARGYFIYCEALIAAGRPEEALAAAETAREHLPDAEDTGTAEAVRLYTALALMLTGDLDQCYDLCAEGLRRMPPDGSEQWISSFLFMLATLVLALRGEHQQAEAALRRALTMRQDLGDPMGIGYCLGLLALVAVQQGQHRQAAWLLGSASPVWKNLGTEPFTGVPGLADLVGGAQATALAALGDETWDTIFNRASVCPLEKAALVAGSPDKLTLAASGQDAAAAPQLPLTRREREIAELVAQALSNRDIAERLFLSVRTVDSHLEHIYKKLGLSSRVKLSAWIHEQASS